MPEGPFGGPRITSLGPLSRSTEEDVRKQWDECPESGKERDICQSFKYHALKILEDQGVFADYETLDGINGGRCSTIALRVYHEVDGVKLMGFSDEHYWIEYRGRAYDAEHPTGVDDAFSLNTFQMADEWWLLDNVQIEAEMEGRKIPDTPEEVIRDASNEDWVVEKDEDAKYYG